MIQMQLVKLVIFIQKIAEQTHLGEKQFHQGEIRLGRCTGITRQNDKKIPNGKTFRVQFASYQTAAFHRSENRVLTVFNVFTIAQKGLRIRKMTLKTSPVIRPDFPLRAYQNKPGAVFGHLRQNQPGQLLNEKLTG